MLLRLCALQAVCSVVRGSCWLLWSLLWAVGAGRLWAVGCGLWSAVRSVEAARWRIVGLGGGRKAHRLPGLLFTCYGWGICLTRLRFEPAPPDSTSANFAPPPPHPPIPPAPSPGHRPRSGRRPLSAWLTRKQGVGAGMPPALRADDPSRTILWFWASAVISNL